MQIGSNNPWMKCCIALAAAVLLMSVVGCRAATETKQGASGEFCNQRDTDCREGLVCENFVCVYPRVGAYTCETMCERLDFCETGEENCVLACRNTIQGWSETAVDAFGECIISGLSCEEARNTDAPQTCYQRIPMDEARRDRCTDFIDAAKNCDASADTSELREQCLYLARTGTDESWERTDGCVDRIADDVCAEVFDCFNDVFLLDPPLNAAP